jgi:hypothetical protein
MLQSFVGLSTDAWRNPITTIDTSLSLTGYSLRVGLAGSTGSVTCDTASQLQNLNHFCQARCVLNAATLALRVEFVPLVVGNYTFEMSSSTQSSIPELSFTQVGPSIVDSPAGSRGSASLKGG